MSETFRCPDCGHANPPGALACERCSYPLVEGAAPAPPPAAPDGGGDPSSGDEPAAPPGSPAPEAGAGAAGPAPFVRPFRPVRPRRPGPRDNVAVSLWLGVGAFVAVLLIFVAVQSNLERANPPVEGSSANQQKAADALRGAIARDSTDAVARVGLADILFDTGNWSEAIVHYSAAVRHDSSQVTALVDLGVCYYNLGVPAEAERLFRLTLARDPHQPYALFNLGIVHERRGDNDTALRYFHSALQASPPENMKPAVMEAMQRVAKATGKEAPPLDPTR